MIRVALIWLLVASSVLAQTPWDEAPVEGIKQTQVVFLTASNAEIAKVDKGVAILAEDLEDDREYGVIIDLPKGLTAKWIEIHSAEKPFPPTIQPPYRDERFLIRGKPGDRFYVSARGDAIPAWFEVLIAPRAPTPPPVEPPLPGPGPAPAPGTPAALEKLSGELARGLNDPTTQAALKRSITSTADSIDALCNAKQCPTLATAKARFVSAIEGELLTRKSPNKDWWTGWRKPVNDAIVAANPVDLKTYMLYMRSVAAGL